MPTENLLTAVCFSDDRRGIAVGHDEIVLTTADGGETWERKHYAPETQQPLLDVLCNGSDGIAVGAYGAYFVSADYGGSWTKRGVRSAEAGSPGGAAPKSGQADDSANEDDALGQDFHLNRIVGGVRLAPLHRWRSGAPLSFR